MIIRCTYAQNLDIANMERRIRVRSSSIHQLSERDRTNRTGFISSLSLDSLSASECIRTLN